MSTDLSVFATLSTPQTYSDAEFDKIASAAGHLPRVMQYTDASLPVKRKEFEAGFYLVTSKDDRTLLGDEFDSVPIAWRFKALETPPGQNPIGSTDPNSDVFKSIQSRADTPNSNCQVGIEYLLWVSALGRFATYFMGSKTARKEAPKLKALLGKPATVKTHVYQNPQYVWSGPKVTASDVAPSSVPTPEELAEVVEKFNTVETTEAPKKVESQNRRPR